MVFDVEIGGGGVSVVVGASSITEVVVAICTTGTVEVATGMVDVATASVVVAAVLVAITEASPDKSGEMFTGFGKDERSDDQVMPRAPGIA